MLTRMTTNYMFITGADNHYRPILTCISINSNMRDNHQSSSFEDAKQLFCSNRCACYLQISEYKEARNDAESCTMIKPTWSKGTKSCEQTETFLSLNQSNV